MIDWEAKARSHEATLRGIASCATLCECCVMHKRVAESAVAKDFEAVELPAACAALMKHLEECETCGL